MTTLLGARAAVAALLFLLLPTIPAAAQSAPEACTCQNLESLQQDYQNAVYLEGFFRQMSTDLKAWETATLAENAAGRSNIDVSISGLARYADNKARNLRFPFPTVSGYTGPESVNMPVGTCQQAQSDLDALERGSPCEAMADAALAHELGHRDICNQTGAAAYWGRMASDFALEEARMYKIQAGNLKMELRRVLDAATIELIGDWYFSADAQGMMTSTHEHLTQSSDIGEASTGDTWTMTGKGESKNSIVSMTIMGNSCSTSGSIRSAFDVAMTTDGITFGLEIASRRTEGDIAVSCLGGGGSSVPTNDAFSGVIAAGQPLVVGDNPLNPGWVDDIKAMMAGGGVTVSGEANTRLSVTCEAP